MKTNTKLLMSVGPTFTCQPWSTCCQRLRHRLYVVRLLPLLLWAVPDAVEAQYSYTTTTNGAVTIPSGITINRYDCSSGDVTITSTITGRTVSAIGPRAFSCSDLTSVTIGSGVISIFLGGIWEYSDVAFRDCTSLTNFTVDALNPAFSSQDGVLFNKTTDTLFKCPQAKLGDYVIPNSVTNITPGAFRSCNHLRSVTIGSGVTQIGAPGLSSFFGNTSLKNFIVDPLNSTYSNLEGVLFNKGQDTLVLYPQGRSGGYIVPNSVTSIGEGAFADCTSLTSLMIPDSVTRIGESALQGCDKLTSLMMSGSVTSIGRYAFSGCAGLTNATIPNGVAQVEESLFESCTGIRSVTMESGVTNLSGALGIFGGCTELRSVFFIGRAPTTYLEGSLFQQAPRVTVYYLPGRTGWGSTFGGRPAVLWNPVIQAGDVGFGVRANGFAFNIAGAPNIPVVVEASTNVATSAWVPLQTLTLANGLASFSDSAWTNHPARFYRLRSP